MDQIEQFADAVFESVKRYIDAVAKRIGDESDKVVAEIEQRLAALQEAIANIPAGEKGDAGERGEKGEAGVSVTIDDVAPLIADQVKEQVAALPPAENGKDGTDGRDGRDGKQGPPGRDALEIDILTKIDLQRQHPRGTFASWDGGVIRAVRLTDPVGDDGIEAAGWAVVVRGLADVTIDQGDDLRTIGVTCRTTAGAPVRKEFTLPALLDRGAAASVHFWFANLQGLRLQLFPRAAQAYAPWRTGDEAPLRAALAGGAVHWERVARDALALHAGNDAALEVRLDALAADPRTLL